MTRPAEPPPAGPCRAIRLPTSLVGRLRYDGRTIEVGIGDISPGGVLAFGAPPIAPGRRFTLSLAGQEFAWTSLRWWADGSAGLEFARPLSPRALSELLEHAGSLGAVLHYERVIGTLLEVVPANDPRG